MIKLRKLLVIIISNIKNSKRKMIIKKQRKLKTFNKTTIRLIMIKRNKLVQNIKYQAINQLFMKNLRILLPKSQSKKPTISLSCQWSFSQFWSLMQESTGPKSSSKIDEFKWPRETWSKSMAPTWHSCKTHEKLKDEVSLPKCCKSKNLS